MENENFENLRQQMQSSPSPVSNFESAFLLIENSDTTKGLPEIDKEFKLSNLKSKDVELVSSLLLSYQEQLSSNNSYLDYYEMQVLQELPEGQVLSDEGAKELLRIRAKFKANKFDDCDHLRRSLSMVSLKRSQDAFERKSQNTVISSQNYSGLPADPMMSGAKPSMMKKFFGGTQQ